MTKFGKKKKTIPGENGIVPMKKINTDAIIFLEDTVSADGSITLVNNAMINVDTFYDTICEETSEIDSRAKEILESTKNDILRDKIKYRMECINDYSLLYPFEKEVDDIIYSCINNILIATINSVTDDRLVMPTVDNFINLEDINYEIDNKYSIYSITVEDHICDEKYTDLIFKDMLRQSIRLEIAKQLYENIRKWVYSVDISVFRLSDDTIKSKVEVTHDNIFYTLQELIRQTCLQIDSGLDIVITKFLYTLFSNQLLLEDQNEE